MMTRKTPGGKRQGVQISDRNYEVLLKVLLPEKYHNEDFDYLIDICVHTELIRLYVGEIRFSEFEEYTAHQILVGESIRKIGSAILNLSPDLRKRNLQTDWKTLDAICDIVSQNNRDNDLAILWDYCTKKMPVVHEQITQMINRELAFIE